MLARSNLLADHILASRLRGGVPTILRLTHRKRARYVIFLEYVDPSTPVLHSYQIIKAAGSTRRTEQPVCSGIYSGSTLKWGWHIQFMHLVTG